jgi:hypothetical protein
MKDRTEIAKGTFRHTPGATLLGGAWACGERDTRRTVEQQVRTEFLGDAEFGPVNSGDLCPCDQVSRSWPRCSAFPLADGLSGDAE